VSPRRRFPALLAVAASSALLASCLVSFDDYPVGSLRNDASAGKGAQGGGGSGGKGGSGGTVGSSSGGSSSGGKGGTVGSTGGSAATSGDAGSPATVGGAGGEGTVEPPTLMIDDFEDGDIVVLPNDNRMGDWLMDDDDVGYQNTHLPFNVQDLNAALEPARGESTRALHTWGGNHDGWGALVRADLNEQNGTDFAYDLSEYTGLKVWARSGNSDNFPMWVAVVTPDAIASRDHFGTSVNVSPEWELYTLPFAAMEQDGWGAPVESFKLDEAVGIQFLLGTNDVDFDVWIDDVTLY
jgi:hypothetical protein